MQSHWVSKLWPSVLSLSDLIIAKQSAVHQTYFVFILTRED